MPQHLLDCCTVVSLCPQELLKIHGVHIIVHFIAHTVAFNPLVGNPQQRAAADHVKTSVDLKELQRSCNFRIFLKLIEKQKRLSGFKPFRGIHSGNVADDIFRLVPILRDELVFGFLHKVDIDHALIGVFCEMEDGLRFSHLPRSFHNKRLPVWIFFP